MKIEWMRLRFTVERMVDGYEALYRSLAGASRVILAKDYQAFRLQALDQLQDPSILIF